MTPGRLLMVWLEIAWNVALSGGAMVFAYQANEWRIRAARATDALRDAMAVMRYGPPPVPAAGCTHRDVRFMAATVVEPLPDGCNANVGVVVSCPACGFSRAGDVRAGLARSPYRGG